jgi:hypothetical protein
MRMRRIALALLLAGAALGAGASCNPPSPPLGSGGAWFVAYQNWCRSCGGTPSANASPARCDPGPNWGGRSSSGSSAGGLTPGQALGRQIGSAAGSLLACALFNQCPGGVDPVVAQLALEHHQAVNTEYKAAVARAEQEQAARIEQSRQRVDSAFAPGAGGLRARDLSASPAPAESPALQQLARASQLSRLASEAGTPERAADLANLAFDAALGGLVETDVPPAAAVDPQLEPQFRTLRDAFLKSSDSALASLQTTLDLDAEIARVAALRKDPRAAKLAALDAQAASAATRLVEEKNRALLDAKRAGAQALDGAARLRDLLARGAPAQARTEQFQFYAGYLHGVQCFADNAVLACQGLDAEGQKRCVAGYRSGYRAGESHKRTLLSQAVELGRQDKAAGRRHSAFTSPGASGPCRISWIESYTEGFQGSSSAGLR